MERCQSGDITNEEETGNGNGWDSSSDVDVFGRRRDWHVESDTKNIREGENTNGVENSVIVPIYKEMEDIRDCGNYRGIKLMSHTMEIWERIIERKLREETTIGDE